ncbi:hypothetical protein ABWH93_15270 [Seohaeicola saemankumensis]|uniref:hypothetical protein n=1 Tax=Seohaeicola TaxID=481178 RepID=UPI0035CF95AB
MKKREFFGLSEAEQEAWVIQKFPDFEAKAYDDTCFGMFFDVLDDQVSEYVEYAEDYETFDILNSALSGFTESRQAEIEAGASLSQAEKLALKRYIADQDIDGWTGLHGWNAECDDGQVFVVFWGFSEGQGGIRLEYARAFETRKQADDWLETFEIFSQM